MDAFLRKHYRTIGDKKLAELFEKKFPKHYPWTLKHIEKRRGYLGIKRTARQVHLIRCENNRDGRQTKTWDARGRMKENEIRVWNGLAYIKVNGKVLLHRRHLANAKPGDIVRTFEGEPRVINRKENQRLNAERRKSLPPELKSTITILNKLKKHVQENRRP